MFKKIGQYYTEVKGELKKSTWPKRQEVRNTTIVVIITVFAFAAYLYVCDKVLETVIFALNDLIVRLFR